MNVFFVSLKEEWGVEVLEYAAHKLHCCPMKSLSETMIPRTILLNAIEIHQPPSLNLLLYGDSALSQETNNFIFEQVHKYILETKRFWKIISCDLRLPLIIPSMNLGSCIPVPTPPPPAPPPLISLHIFDIYVFTVLCFISVFIQYSPIFVNRCNVYKWMFKEKNSISFSFRSNPFSAYMLCFCVLFVYVNCSE